MPKTPKTSMPRAEELMLAADRLVPDIIAPNLSVLFCGINPGLYSAWCGHHFGRPGNRFWPALYQSGFTPKLFEPSNEAELLSLGLGITNLVERASKLASELTAFELKQGGQALAQKAARYRPAWIAILGLQAYRTAFDQPKAQVGRQPLTLGAAKLWLLPGPSGLNAHYTIPQLAQVFTDFRQEINF